MNTKQMCITQMQATPTFDLKWDYHTQLVKIARSYYGGLECAPMEVKDAWRDLMLTHQTLMDGAQGRLF